MFVRFVFASVALAAALFSPANAEQGADVRPLTAAMIVDALISVCHASDDPELLRAANAQTEANGFDDGAIFFFGPPSHNADGTLGPVGLSGTAIIAGNRLDYAHRSGIGGFCTFRFPALPHAQMEAELRRRFGQGVRQGDAVVWTVQRTDGAGDVDYVSGAHPRAGQTWVQGQGGFGLGFDASDGNDTLTFHAPAGAQH